MLITIIIRLYDQYQNPLFQNIVRFDKDLFDNKAAELATHPNYTNRISQDVGVGKIYVYVMSPYMVTPNWVSAVDIK